VVYNLPGLGSLRLSPETLANVFLGKVQNWNDPAIAKDNPGAKLPDSAIAVVHRSDGSGTTAVFTDYLAKVSPEWKSGPGAGKSVNWPVGLGGKGNEGVTGTEEHTSELQSPCNLVCRLLLEKKKQSPHSRCPPRHPPPHKGSTP